MSNKQNLIVAIIVLLVLPSIFAGTYGSGIYGADNYSAVDVATSSSSSSSSSSGGGGGGSGSQIVKVDEVKGCTNNAECKELEYCFEGSCFSAECLDDTACKQDEVCHQYMCVKLFDVEIKEFESPVKLGDFFEFTYLIKGMADFNDDVLIKFKIEKDGSSVTSGQDVIYLASFEEKTKSTKLFLPSTVASGVYDFSVEVSYGKYTARSFRTIEIIVGDDMAQITLLPEQRPLVGSAAWWHKVQPFLFQNIYFIIAGIGVIIFGIIIIVLIKKVPKKKKRQKKSIKQKRHTRSFRQRILKKLKVIKK